MKEKKREARRRALVRIDSFFISCLCRSTTIEIKSPVPSGAKYIGTNYDPRRDCYFVCFEHESFDLIPIGDKLPVLDDVECQHIVKEEDS